MIFSSYFYFHDFIGRIHFMGFFISSNLIFFSMHSLGIFGFPRRIFDYPILFFKFNWLNTFGLVGVVLSILFFVAGFVVLVWTLITTVIIVIIKIRKNESRRTNMRIELTFFLSYLFLLLVYMDWEHSIWCSNELF